MRRSRIGAFLLWLFLLLCLLTVFLFTHAAAALCCLCFFPLLTLLSFLNSLRFRKGLRVSLSLPTLGAKEQTVEGQITLADNRLLTAGRLFCTLRVENNLTGESEKHTLALTGQDTVFEVCAAHCGRLSVQIERLLLTDCFGLLTVRTDAAASAHMTVLPDTFTPELHLTLPPVPSPDGDAYDATRRGSDPTEPFLLRDYAPGDSLKQIHWKLSGKLDRLIVREASLPAVRSILVFWDKGGTPAVLDAQAEVLSSVCQALCEQGFFFSLGWTENDGPVFVEISDTERLLNVLPQILRHAAPTNGVGLAHYLAQHGSVGFGKLFYFSACLPDMLRDFAGSADLTLFLCTDTAPQLPLPALVYSPENYREALERIELVSGDANGFLGGIAL